MYTTVRKNIPTYIERGKKELIALYPKELELRISNGNLYTNVKEPYSIEFPSFMGDMGGKHLAVIDTKGSADNYPKYSTMVLATKQTLVFPSKEQGTKTSTQIYYFSDLKRSVYMDHTAYMNIVQSLNPLLAKLPRIIDIAVLVCLILLPFLGALLWTSSTLFGLFFLTVIVWMIEKIIKTSYGFKTLFRMGIHGVTWSILFSFLMDITNQKANFLFSLIFIVWMTVVLIKNRDQKIVA